MDLTASAATQQEGVAKAKGQKDFNEINDKNYNVLILTKKLALQITHIYDINRCNCQPT